MAASEGLRFPEPLAAKANFSPMACKLNGNVPHLSCVLKRNVHVLPDPSPALSPAPGGRWSPPTHLRPLVFFQNSMKKTHALLLMLLYLGEYLFQQHFLPLQNPQGLLFLQVSETGSEQGTWLSSTH